MKQYASDARQDHRYHNNFNVLTDLTDCELSIAPAELRTLADFMNKNWPTGDTVKAALILDNDLAHGLARMYDVYSKNRAKDPTFFHDNQPNLHLEIQTYFELPEDYQLPDFIAVQH